MATPEQDLYARVRGLVPPLPCFARLLDARRQLDALSYMRFPELHSRRLFVALEAVFDRDAEHPGLWVRPLVTGRQQRPVPAAFWLPADQLVFDPRFPIN